MHPTVAGLGCWADNSAGCCRRCGNVPRTGGPYRWGDAELVAGLDATSTGMTVSSYGSIDALEIRTLIRQVLEDGEEAFMRRYKYGGMRLDLPTSR